MEEWKERKRKWKGMSERKEVWEERRSRRKGCVKLRKIMKKDRWKRRKERYEKTRGGGEKTK